MCIVECVSVCVCVSLCMYMYRVCVSMGLSVWDVHVWNMCGGVRAYSVCGLCVGVFVGGSAVCAGMGICVWILISF